jgi:hypothetical protein
MRTFVMVAVLVLGAVAGCNKPKKVKPTTPATEATPAPSGGGNTGYVSGGGAAQNVRQAARRVVALTDMKELGTAITQWEVENGRMPNKAEITNLAKGYRNLASLIADGTIILTGTTQRSGLWAYEIEADVKGGIGLVSGVPNRYDAETIKQYLGR